MTVAARRRDRRPYGERAYLAARKRLVSHPSPCIYCGRPATTIDHVPPLALHDHVAASGCCELHPCCLPCNSRGGQRIGRRRRAVKRAVAREANASRVW